MIDTGAWNNLVGSSWVDRMNRQNKAIGKVPSTEQKLAKPVVLGGVGKDTQEAKHRVTMPTTIGGADSQFSATMIDGSNLPALLGLKTLKEKNGILDLRTNRLIMSNSSDSVTIDCPVGTTVLQLEPAPGGYLMLPCTPMKQIFVRILLTIIIKPNRV